MIFPDLTAEVTLRTLLDYESEYANATAAEIRSARDMYENETEPDLPPDMGPDLVREYKQDWTPAPVGKMIVNRLTSAMLRRDTERTTGNDALTPVYDEALLQMPRRLPLVVRMASTYGHCVLRLRPDYRQGVGFSLWRPSAPNGPDGAIPIIDSDDPQGEPLGIIYRYSYHTATEQADLARGRYRREHKVVECITRHQRDPLTGVIVQPGIRVKYVDDVRVPYYDGDSGLNPLGDYLGAVLWRNSDSMEHAYGESDVLPLMALLRRINHTITDGHMLLKWNVWPLTYITGGRSKGDLPYHWRAIWEIVGDGTGGTPSVGKLESNPAHMGSLLDYVRYLMQLISMTSAVPSFSLGDLSGIGQLSSGRAYEIAMTPLSDAVALRTPVLIDNEMMLMREVVALGAYRTTQDAVTESIKGLAAYLSTAPGLPAMPDYRKIDAALVDAVVEYGPVSMAHSEMDAATVHGIRIGAGYESTEQAIRSTHPSWTDDQVADELERIQGAGDEAALDTVAQARIQAMRDRLGQSE